MDFFLNNHGQKRIVDAAVTFVDFFFTRNEDDMISCEEFVTLILNIDNPIKDGMWDAPSCFIRLLNSLQVMFKPTAEFDYEFKRIKNFFDIDEYMQDGYCILLIGNTDLKCLIPNTTSTFDIVFNDKTHFWSLFESGELIQKVDSAFRIRITSPKG